MNINIAGNLKRLRKQREITQEALADFIGVSFQAVSKWECGDGYPDITLLPALANFFDVSLDELLGMNEIKNAEKLEEIKAQHRMLTSEGKIKEDILLLREALKAVPNDYWLLAELACSLDGYGETDEERSRNQSESVKISERIIEFCADPIIRSNVQSNMCFSLWRNGDKEKAIELAEKLPNIYKTREFTVNKFLDRDRQIRACQNTIQELAWGFWWQINLLAERWDTEFSENHEHYTAEQAIELHKKSIAMYKIIYDEGDCYFAHCRISDSYERIAQICMGIGKIDEAVENLRKASEHSIMFSTLPEKHNYTSVTVNAPTHEMVNTFSHSEKNNAYRLKDHIENMGAYDTILNDERVKEILNELERYSN